MSLQGVFPFVCDFFPQKPVQIEVANTQLTSDAGLLPIRQLDEALGFTEQFAKALVDARSSAVTHSLLSMVRQRIFGILADYEDQNDHDTLRSDPVFKLICDRSPDALDLASQPTLSRFENAVTPADLFRLRDELCHQFLKGFTVPPPRITLDVDAFDDPTHGHQQLTLFHGFYGQYQYYPIVWTCAETDEVVLVGLRHGTAAASLGADRDLRYLVTKIRERFPATEIIVRGDGGFGLPLMYNVCEELGVTNTFGLAMNSKLKQASDDLLAQAWRQYEETGQKQRLFQSVLYQAESWAEPRQVVIKCEVHQQGENRRAVSTNRPGWSVLPGAVYEEYADRGESENRNKELKVELSTDRLSDSRFMANFFRLYLHTAALNLLVRLRRALGPVGGVKMDDLPQDVPPEAFREDHKRTYQNRCRRQEPLREGFACTWRTRLIKCAAEVVVSARRVLVRISSSWPYAADYGRVLSAIMAVRRLT